MAPKPRGHDDYTVGWVCALPKEQTAAIAMLDERHNSLPKPSNDHNTYSLGSIGKHNIVIACLPKGKYGTIPAADVAAQMTRTFPAIRFSLMVGIGGGIPPKVRLGDVVVSTPTSNYPGVVQWDMGKSKHCGNFFRTGQLNNPPTSLLTALSTLETEQDLMGSKIPQFLDDLKGKWPQMAAKYLKSDRMEDVLYRSHYVHISRSRAEQEDMLADEDEAEYDEETDDEEDMKDDCRYCDMTQRVKRKPRKMRVHYGLIASGNKLIKDATVRDELKKAFNDEVLCVEMEAAGLMDNFPCVVIRGICDYADTHKNDVWQEYAAVVAAALAKELLGYIQPSDVERERSVCDVMDGLYSRFDSIDRRTVEISTRFDKAEDLNILDWLTPMNYGPQQSDTLQRRHPATGQWFLNDSTYHEWVDEPGGILFCPGMPGAGKTIITSIVIDDLSKMIEHDDSSAMAYIYCSFDRKDEQKLEALLASLLKQLVRYEPVFPANLKKLYNKHRRGETRPSLEEISEILKLVLTERSRVFIVIDALDECEASDACRTKLLSEIFELRGTGKVNILATSRPLPEIEDYFCDSLEIQISARPEDITEYLHGRMTELAGFVSKRPDLQTSIVDSITTTAGGMFLLARLYFDSLIGIDTPKQLKITLQQLETTSNAYDAAYQKTMERIEGQVHQQTKRAKSVLSWITCARRPLTTWELQHALGVEPKSAELDQENLPEIEDAVSTCHGLLTIDQDSNVVRLAHYTTREYFERTNPNWFASAQANIATACITYLSFQAFSSGPCSTFDEFERRGATYPFYDYASTNWGHHTRRAELTWQQCLPFFQMQAQIDSASQAITVFQWRRRYGRCLNIEWYPKQGTGLHLAAEHGLFKVIETCSIDCDLNAEDTAGRTPLSLAAGNGHEDIVELLVKSKGVCPNAEDEQGLTPLMIAATLGNEETVKVLLTADGVDLNSRCSRGRTPLHWACLLGYEGIVKCLLESGDIDADARDLELVTPLASAAREGHLWIVGLLVICGRVDINARDSFGRSALYHASWEGHHLVVEFLLFIDGIDIDSRCFNNQTPLEVAAEKSHRDVIGLFLKAKGEITRGVDIDVKYIRYRTPVHEALAHGREGIAQFLVGSANSDAYWETEPSHSPGLVSVAGKGRWEALIKMLLTTPGFNPNNQDEHGVVPLSYAASGNNEAIVRLLLDSNRVDPATPDRLGRVPLSYAAANGREGIVKLLLGTAGVDPNTPDISSRTPLWYAAYGGSEVVVKLLFGTRSIDLSIANRCSKSTPLKIATARGHHGVVKL